MNNKTRNSIKLIKLFLLIFIILYMINILLNESTKKYAHISPSYVKIDIIEILNKNNLNNDDYKILFYQTGLGKTAIDKLIKTNDGIKKILKIQENFFDEVKVYANPITPFTYEETNIDINDNKKLSTLIGYLDNGYILITRATYTFGWRHGHAAIVVDSNNGYILESAVLGEPSQLSYVDKFRYYPNFIILKPKESTQNQLNKIACYSLKALYKVPYRISCGIFMPKYIENTAPEGTQCSHLVWYAYMSENFDIDSNGGKIVTPKDIANSDLLEIVQFYGFDPDELWNDN